MRGYGNSTNETKSGNCSFRTAEKIIGLVCPTLSSDPVPAVKHENQAPVGTCQNFHSFFDAIGHTGGARTNSRLYEPTCARCSLPLFTHIMRCCCVWDKGKTQTSLPQQNCRVATQGRCTVTTLALFLSFTVTAAAERHQTLSRNIFLVRAFLIDTTLFSNLNIDIFYILAKHKFRHQNMPVRDFFFYCACLRLSSV